MTFTEKFAGTRSYSRSTLKSAVFGLLTLLLSLVTDIEICIAEDQALEGKTKPLINFRESKIAYRTVKVGKWSFEIDQQLIDEAPETAAKATKRLQENIDIVFRLIPKASQPKLRKLKYFILYGPKARGGGQDNGLRYFPTDSPKFHPTADERWSACIVIYCAENYSKISDLWALKSVIHEVGHAHHLENWHSNQPHIMEAWTNAVEKGLYMNVKDEKGAVIQKAYAHTNQLEYFAELTAIYFARCNYAPFDRVMLKKYDPVGYEMVRKMWGLAKDDPAPPATNGTPPATPDNKDAKPASPDTKAVKTPPSTKKGTKK